MWRISLLAFVLIGCSSTPPKGCEFDLNGWNKAIDIPVSLQSKNKKNITHWYVNHDGDYFFCENFVDSNVCGQNFEIHYKKQHGSYSSDSIMCMQ